MMGIHTVDTDCVCAIADSAVNMRWPCWSRPTWLIHTELLLVAVAVAVEAGAGEHILKG